MARSGIDPCTTDRDKTANTARFGRRRQTGTARPPLCGTDAIPGLRTREHEPGTRRGAVGRSWSGSRRGAATASRLCLDARRKEMTQ